MDLNARRSVSVKIIQLVILQLVIVTVCLDFTASSAMKVCYFAFILSHLPTFGQTLQSHLLLMNE